MGVFIFLLVVLSPFILFATWIIIRIKRDPDCSLYGENDDDDYDYDYDRRTSMLNNHHIDNIWHKWDTPSGRY